MHKQMIFCSTLGFLKPSFERVAFLKLRALDFWVLFSQQNFYLLTNFSRYWMWQSDYDPASVHKRAHSLIKNSLVMKRKSKYDCILIAEASENRVRKSKCHGSIGEGLRKDEVARKSLTKNILLLGAS